MLEAIELEQSSLTGQSPDTPGAQQVFDNLAARIGGHGELSLFRSDTDTVMDTDSAKQLQEFKALLGRERGAIFAIEQYTFTLIHELSHAYGTTDLIMGISISPAEYDAWDAEQVSRDVRYYCSEGLYETLSEPRVDDYYQRMYGMSLSESPGEEKGEQEIGEFEGLYSAYLETNGLSEPAAFSGLSADEAAQIHRYISYRQFTNYLLSHLPELATNADIFAQIVAVAHYLSHGSQITSEAVGAP